MFLRYVWDSHSTVRMERGIIGYVCYALIQGPMIRYKVTLLSLHLPRKALPGSVFVRDANYELAREPLVLAWSTGQLPRM